MNNNKSSKTAAYTGIFAAIAASSCCIPPVIALIAGVGGSASALSWMEPFRPYLIGLAIVAIGYAWYNYFKHKPLDDCACEIDKPKWFQTKGFLVGITLFSAVSIAFPYYSHVFYSDNAKEIVFVNPSDVQNAIFGIKGMTCNACEKHVIHAINELEGIVNVAASYGNADATVEFDGSTTSLEDITKAINGTGYEVIKSELTDKDLQD